MPVMQTKSPNAADLAGVADEEGAGRCLSPVQTTPPTPPPLPHSASAVSINSNLSTCSSSALPVPVKQCWYEAEDPPCPPGQAGLHCPPSTSSLSPPTSPPANASQPSIPATVATWFDNLESKFNNSEKQTIITENSKQSCSDQTSLLLNDILDELIIDEIGLEIQHPPKKTTEESKLESPKKPIPELASSVPAGSSSPSISCLSSDARITASPPRSSANPQDPARTIFLTDGADNQSDSAPTVIESSESLLVVPQSPSEIRKKFQTASSFERTFTKSSDIEFSQEFKAGIRGKVKESRDNFLKQATVEMAARESRAGQEELRRQIQQDRQAGLEESGEESCAYLAEKRERAMELQLLVGRARSTEQESAEQQQDRAAELRDERRQELADLAQRRLEPATTEDPALSEVERSEAIWNERAEELRQIATRCKSPWQQSREQKETSGERTAEFGDQNVRSKVRSTAAAWKEREKSGSREQESRETTRPEQRDLPTRRIGSLFRRDSDYWNLEPEPEVEPESPAAPLRQSSRGRVDQIRQQH